jgi:glutaredoxin
MKQTADEHNKIVPPTKVVMYCNKWCPDCKAARTWLLEHDIPFTEVDITTDINATRQVRKWGNGFQITPTIDINGEIILDFDEEKLSRILLKR